MGPSINQHVRRGHPAIFGLLIFFGVIEVSISAWLTAKYGKHHNATRSSQVIRTHFILFASCWTVVMSAIYLGVFQVFWSSGFLFTSVASHFIYLFFTWILWIAGAAAITQTLGGGLNCATQDTFVYCTQLNAMLGFAWVEAILVTIAIIIVLLLGIASARRGDGYQGQLVSA